MVKHPSSLRSLGQGWRKEKVKVGNESERPQEEAFRNIHEIGAYIRYSVGRWTAIVDARRCSGPCAAQQRAKDDNTQTDQLMSYCEQQLAHHGNTGAVGY